MRVSRTGTAAPWRATPRVEESAGGFADLMQPDAAAGQTRETSAPGAVETAAPGAPQADAAVRDHLARQHGDATLRALSSAQAALLGDRLDAARCTLAALVRTRPAASDPGLDAVLRAIAVRAAVELARGD